MRIKKILFCLVLLLVFSGCSNKKHLSSDKTIMVCSDLHYLSKDLYDDGSSFQRILETNDGKLIERSEEILEWLVEEVLKIKPDVFVISGDITFNGEMTSLKEVKKKLLEIQDNGIKVLVIPGNHDITSGKAYSFLNGEFGEIEGVTQLSFLEVMKDFGYEEAYKKDEDSFSYILEIDNDWLVSIDANTEGNIGTITEKTLVWLEDILSEAKDKNKRVTIISHQNVLRQNDYLYKGFVINNEEEVVSLLKKYDVRLALSGHSHIQHISTSGKLVDICNESVMLFPISYGLVNLKEEGYEYKRISNESLANEAKQRFDNDMNRGLEDRINNYEIKEEDKEIIKEYIKDINRAIFSGDKEEIDSLKDDYRRALFDKYIDSGFLHDYLQNAFSD